MTSQKKWIIQKGSTPTTLATCLQLSTFFLIPTAQGTGIKKKGAIIWNLQILEGRIRHRWHLGFVTVVGLMIGSSETKAKVHTF